MKFKVGDRVASYGYFRDDDGYHHTPHLGDRGTVLEIIGNFLRLKMDFAHETGTVHHQQCRRLVKKKK